mmetsp:Transcript_25585/g.30961  ORF Transcript_25585/g.30961 Transcript_25585/m.30961 type:complete len:105 (+) Transcript_25585:404-718(+)
MDPETIQGYRLPVALVQTGGDNIAKATTAKIKSLLNHRFGIKQEMISGTSMDKTNSVLKNSKPDYWKLLRRQMQDVPCLACERARRWTKRANPEQGGCRFDTGM